MKSCTGNYRQQEGFSFVLIRIRKAQGSMEILVTISRVQTITAGIRKRETNKDPLAHENPKGNAFRNPARHRQAETIF